MRVVILIPVMICFALWVLSAFKLTVIGFSIPNCACAIMVDKGTVAAVGTSYGSYGNKWEFISHCEDYTGKSNTEDGFPEILSGAIGIGSYLARRFSEAGVRDITVRTGANGVWMPMWIPSTISIIYLCFFLRRRFVAVRTEQEVARAS